MSHIAYVMRGPSGSGKTSWLRQYVPLLKIGGWPKLGYVCSADHGHMDQDGNYNYKKENVQKAHDDCFRRYIEILREHKDAGDFAVACDNTNIRVWEFWPYVKAATAYGWQVKIIRIVCPPEMCIDRTIHKVPAEVIWKMHTDMENLPPPWLETPVFVDRSSGCFRRQAGEI